MSLHRLVRIIYVERASLISYSKCSAPYPLYTSALGPITAIHVVAAFADEQFNTIDYNIYNIRASESSESETRG